MKPEEVAWRQKLMADNVRLAWHVARNMHHGKYQDLEDVFQEGCVGLALAAQLYDPTRGIKFCTYAYHAIWRRIARYQKMRQRLQAAEDVVVASSHEDTTFANPQDVVADRDMLQYVLQGVEPREHRILQLHSQGMSYREIGARYGVTGEAVRKAVGIVRRQAQARLASAETPRNTHRLRVRARQHRSPVRAGGVAGCPRGDGDTVL